MNYSAFANPAFWTGLCLLASVLKTVLHHDDPSPAQVSLDLGLGFLHLVSYRVAAIKSISVRDQMSVVFQEVTQQQTKALTSNLGELIKAAIEQDPEQVQRLLDDSRAVKRGL